MANSKPPTTMSSNSLLLPSTTTTNTGAMLAPTTTPQKLTSGSATGNPRNKCALKPGHSLMDWVRLGSSGADLSGTQGRVIPVTIEELAKHNKREDAWLAIRGKVFNVTRYMDFHPGGVDELMRGVGRDATKLFDDVHAWVNYQQLLAKCFIGPLRGPVVRVENDLLKALQTKIKTSESAALPPMPPKNPPEIIPRFDWIQKRTDITFYIYTRPFCNPGLIVQRKSDSILQLRVQIEIVTHVYEFELQNSIEWPPKSLKLSSETGKIEMTVSKRTPDLWTTYGKHETKKLKPGDEAEEWQQDFEISTNTNFNHDSFQMRLLGMKDTLMLLPIGYHVTITANINGEIISRSYTPVDAQFLPPTTDVNNDGFTHLHFIVKSYESGLLTPHLKQLKSPGSVQLSAPKGSFKLSKLQAHRRITLLAAGSGLTPFLNLIEHLLRRVTNKIEYLHLMYFNKTEADIWCREFLEKLQAKDERFHYTNILSQPGADWMGLQGRLTSDLLLPLSDKNSAQYGSFVAVCGPSGFNQHAEQLLENLKYNVNDFHVFQG